MKTLKLFCFILICACSNLHEADQLDKIETYEDTLNNPYVLFIPEKELWDGAELKSVRLASKDIDNLVIHFIKNKYPNSTIVFLLHEHSSAKKYYKQNDSTYNYIDSSLVNSQILFTQKKDTLKTILQIKNEKIIFDTKPVIHIK